LLLLVLMLLTVIPAFKLAFASQGQGLPGPTLLVIALSDGVCAHGLYMLAGAGVGLLGLRRGWQRFPGWRAALDRWCLRFPLSGSLSRQLVLVRWCRTLSMLIAAGVPLLDALLSAGQAAGNRVYLEASVKVQRRIRLGSSLTASLRADRCFPPLLLQLATVGEASGALDQVFERAAQYYEQQAEDALQLLTSVLEPLAMAVLGVLCAALIWALYLPIFQLGQVLG
jgi:type IV pilus assembly protein PilC